MSDTSVPRSVRREDVERNTPGNPVEIPYVQVPEELTERGTIGIKLPNGTKIGMMEIHRTANKEMFLMPLVAGDRSLHDFGFYLKARKCETIIKKCVVILKENHQQEPGASTRCPSGTYQKASVRHS